MIVEMRDGIRRQGARIAAPRVVPEPGVAGRTDAIRAAGGAAGRVYLPGRYLLPVGHRDHARLDFPGASASAISTGGAR